MQPLTSSSHPIRVMYVDHTAKWSGGEVALLRVLEAIDRRVVAPLVVLGEDGPLVTHLRNADIETIIVPLGESVREVRKDTLSGKGIVGQFGTGVRLIRYAATLARLAQRREIDIVHTNSLKSDLYGALAGRMARVPVIWHIRDHIDVPYLPAAAARMFRTLASTLPSYVIANSASTLETLRQAESNPGVSKGKPGRAFVVHDGLRVSESAEQAATRPGFQNPPRIGLVGRIVAWKGQHIFLEAAARVKRGGFDAKYLVIGGALFGEQEFEKELHRMAENLGIAAEVEFLGFRNDVPELLQSLDILVHASTTPEPFGQVVIEGMAARLPVIATNGGGVREIVRDGIDGILVPMGDPDAMAEAIRDLLADPVRARALGRAGYERVQTSFSANRSARALEAIYSKIVGRNQEARFAIPEQKRIQS